MKIVIIPPVTMDITSYFRGLTLLARTYLMPCFPLWSRNRYGTMVVGRDHSVRRASGSGFYVSGLKKKVVDFDIAYGYRHLAL